MTTATSDTSIDDILSVFRECGCPSTVSRIGVYADPIDPTVRYAIDWSKLPKFAMDKPFQMGPISWEEPTSAFRVRCELDAIPVIRSPQVVLCTESDPIPFRPYRRCAVCGFRRRGRYHDQGEHHRKAVARSGGERS